MVVRQPENSLPVLDPPFVFRLPDPLRSLHRRFKAAELFSLSAEAQTMITIPEVSVVLFFSLFFFPPQ